MTANETKFKFPLVDRYGAELTSDGFLGAFGLSDKYSGKTCDEDPLVVAIRTSLSGEKLTAEQALLIRSFVVDWLWGRNPKLGGVVGFSCELQECISFLAQIGFLERTVTYAGRTALGIASFALTWELLMADEVVVDSLINAAVVDVALAGLPSGFEAKIDNRFGMPGSAVSRACFDIEPILVLLQCCHMRRLVAEIDADESLRYAMVKRLDFHIFSMLMLNSRQLEGLVCSGPSEAAASVAAHAALALGLRSVPDRGDIFEMLRQNISALECGVRQKEGNKTLDAIEKHCELDTDAIQRQLNRQLISAATTEALDLAVTPLRASLQLMSLVAGGMESIVPGQYSQAFGLVKSGCDSAKSATSSTLDAVASAFDRGISAEAWARKQIGKVTSVFSKE